MAVQVRRLEALMATVLISLLVLTMINGGFHGRIIITAEGALDPMCGASDTCFCNPTDSAFPEAVDKVLSDLRVRVKCDVADYNYGSQYTYIHTSCANGPTCDDCLNRATQIMRQNCPGKIGAQYGNEECCARYELNNFCGYRYFAKEKETHHK
ncbi:unnamed protein product [Linum trigynum]|uniref:Gnk2-homologous domain-containing protein n=1 Tax=Linum trigynum TaxID=586398 RepID=A0AAV2CNM1_9ROSI